MEYLLSTLKGKDRDKSRAFATVGFIAVAVGDDIIPYLPKIMDAIKFHLPSKVSFQEFSYFHY